LDYTLSLFFAFGQNFFSVNFRLFAGGFDNPGSFGFSSLKAFFVL
jgi:hypothetical protein